jgi:hypothetical protein
MGAILGMIGALVGIGLFMFGFYFGKSIYETKLPDPAEPTPEEVKAIQEERDRLIKEQEAFRDLVNYNAATAYGITGDSLKTLEQKSG